MTDDRWHLQLLVETLHQSPELQDSKSIMCFQPLKNCTESEQRCKITRAQPNPRFGFPRLPALFPLPLFVGTVRLNVFFPLSGHGNPMSSQIPYCAGGAEQIFVEVPAPVSVMFPHKKPLASLSVSTKN